MDFDAVILRHTKRLDALERRSVAGGVNGAVAELRKDLLAAMAVVHTRLSAVETDIQNLGVVLKAMNTSAAPPPPQPKSAYDPPA